MLWNFLWEAKLVVIVHSLHQNLAFIGEKGVIWVTSKNFNNLMEDQVVLDQSRTIGVDLSTVENLTTLLYGCQSQLSLRINSLPSTPDKNLLLVGDSNHWVEATSNIWNTDHFIFAVWILKLDWSFRVRLDLKQDTWVIDSQNSTLVVAPSKDLSLIG